MLEVRDLVKRAQLMYFQRCEELHILPKFNSDILLCEQNDMKVDEVSFHGLLLNRPDDVAAMFTLLADLRAPLLGLDCSGCALLPASTHVVVEEIYARPSLHS